jgi:hypothetical protein
MEHLRPVLQCFEEGLKLRLKKCFFGLQEMKYLGDTVSACKISVSTKNVEAVANWPVHTTQKEVRSFVQFSNFYAGYSSLQRPYGSIDGLTAEVPTTKGHVDACLFGSLWDSQVTAHFRAILPEVSSDETFTVAADASTVGLQQSCCKTKEEDLN